MLERPILPRGHRSGSIMGLPGPMLPLSGLPGDPLQALRCTEAIFMLERPILPQGHRSGGITGLPGPMLLQVGLLRM